MPDISTEIIDGEEWRTTTMRSGAVVREIVSPPPEETETQKTIYTTLEFMQLLGDDNMLNILTAAKTDVAVELFVEKLKRAAHVDFNDAGNGPAQGMAFLLSQGIISQDEHDRIMNREMP